MVDRIAVLREPSRPVKHNALDAGPGCRLAERGPAGSALLAPITWGAPKQDNVVAALYRTNLWPDLLYNPCPLVSKNHRQGAGRVPLITPSSL